MSLQHHAFTDDEDTRVDFIEELAPEDVIEDEEVESLDPAMLFTDSVIGPRPKLVIDTPLEIAYLQAPPPPPRFDLATRAPLPEPRRLGVAYAAGAAVALATFAATASVLWVYFH
jgi:hypothetical protein